MQKIIESEETNRKKAKNRIRRNNAKLYPMYKMFSWDLICFYSIQFLFYTMTKKITASQVLIVSALYILSKLLMQIPAVTISDIIGRKKSIVLGNILLAIHLIILIFFPGIISIIIANIIRALGADIKTISETNLLYDSVSTKGGEGLYTKLDSKGASWYYYLDGIACLSAGYLFVINNYIPIVICLILTIISTLIALKFKDVYEVKKENSKKLSKVIKEYSKDLKESTKFIIKSKRMKSYIIFGAIFYGIITIMETYREELLIEIGVPEEQFSIILAVLTLLAGISTSLSRKVHKKFRNKTLAFISLTYVISSIIISILAITISNNVVIPIILVMYAISRMGEGVWYVLEYKYLKNFTTEEIRNKIMFTYELIGGIGASLLSLMGSIILNLFEIKNAFILVGLIALLMIVLILDYMRTRFGLAPNEYSKTDIEF